MYRPENKMVDLKRANIDPIRIPADAEHAVAVDVLRLDKINPVISGNKWFKLKSYLADAIQNGYDELLTFGGAYSNHIIATAYAAMQSGVKATALIRGEEAATLSATLKEASAYGMKLHFISRESYKQKENHPLVSELIDRPGKYYIIPEGGAGKKGIEGSKDILQLTNAANYSHIICAVGTGTMFTGIAAAASGQQQLIGIPVIKGFQTAAAQITEASAEIFYGKNCRFFFDYHFGGYAKKTRELIEFMNEFYSNYQIPSDFVYTGKLFYALSRLIAQQYFPADAKVLAIHSGGLQGNRSLPEGTLLF